MTRLQGHDELRVDHEVGRQFLQGVQVVPERLLDDVSLADAGCANVTLEKFFRRRRDECRDLGFFLHRRKSFYTPVDAAVYRVCFIPIADMTPRRPEGLRDLSRSAYTRGES